MKKAALIVLISFLGFLLFFSVIGPVIATDDNFVLMEGIHVNLYMPGSSVGVNFTDVLSKCQATKVCDAGYELLEEVIGIVPYSGKTINITAEGYDGQENAPVYAAHSGNPIVVVYDRLSSNNYILSSTSEEGSNSVPNFGLYFHEMWHDFTPIEFAKSFSAFTYMEGFARFNFNFINLLIIKNAQDYGLSQYTVGKIEKYTTQSLGYERTIDPNNVNFTAYSNILLSAFLHKVADNYTDCGFAVFKSFFEKVKDINGLIPAQSDLDKNSLFIALINTVTGSDHRSDFKYYGFNTDDSSYATYIENITTRNYLPSPSPTPSHTPTPTPTPTPTSSPSPTPSPTPTASLTPSPSPTPFPPSPTPSPTPSPSSSPAPSATPTPTPSPTPTATPTQTPTPTPSSSPSPSPSQIAATALPPEAFNVVVAVGIISIIAMATVVFKKIKK